MLPSGLPYRTVLKVANSKQRALLAPYLLGYLSDPKMEAIAFSETSINFYWTTRRHMLLIITAGRGQNPNIRCAKFALRTRQRRTEILCLEPILHRHTEPDYRRSRSDVETHSDRKKKFIVVYGDLSFQLCRSTVEKIVHRGL